MDVIIISGNIMLEMLVFFYILIVCKYWYVL